MKFFLRIHALNTSLILVLTSLYKSVGLTARQLAFLAFVVAPVELIYDEVLDVFKMSSSKTGCRAQGSEPYWV